MSSEKDALKKKIIDFLNKSWGEIKKPLLLSKIPSILNEVNHKDILDGMSLKCFIEETSGEGGYKIIEDPRNKARVGIIPFSETYTYQENANNKKEKNISSNKDGVLVEFLRLLSSLSDEELDSIVIPARVLAKLVR